MLGLYRWWYRGLGTGTGWVHYQVRARTDVAASRCTARRGTPVHYGQTVIGLTRWCFSINPGGAFAVIRAWKQTELLG